VEGKRALMTSRFGGAGVFQKFVIYRLQQERFAPLPLEIKHLENRN
jgi:hypothetical protein